MNVNDVERQTVDGDVLAAIFTKQAELMWKYHELETKNGTGYARVKKIPVDLNDTQGQYLLKDFAWRVTEEVTESTEAIPEYDPLGITVPGEDAWLHAREEAADALHFLIELYILAGIQPADVQTFHGLSFDLMFDGLRFLQMAPRAAAYNLVEDLGKAMNLLKNKPWKSTQMLTDETRFRVTLMQSLQSFVKYAMSVGIRDAEQMVDLYLRKAKVNEFRQRSAY